MILVYTPEVLKMGKVYALFSLFEFYFPGGLFRRILDDAPMGLLGLRRLFRSVNQMVCLSFGTWDKNTLGPLLALAVAGNLLPEK